MFSSVSVCKIKNSDAEATMPAPSVALRNCSSAVEVYCASLRQHSLNQQVEEVCFPIIQLHHLPRCPSQKSAGPPWLFLHFLSAKPDCHCISNEVPLISFAWAQGFSGELNSRNPRESCSSPDPIVSFHVCISVFGQFTFRVTGTTSFTRPCTISPYTIKHSSYWTCRDSGESAHVPISCLPQAQQLRLSNISASSNPIHIFSWLIILSFDDLSVDLFCLFVCIPCFTKKTHHFSL